MVKSNKTKAPVDHEYLHVKKEPDYKTAFRILLNEKESRNDKTVASALRRAKKGQNPRFMQQRTKTLLHQRQLWESVMKAYRNSKRSVTFRKVVTQEYQS